MRSDDAPPAVLFLHSITGHRQREDQVNKADQAEQLRSISEAATALQEAADEAADAFEADPGEYAKEDRDDLLNEAENAASELLAVIPTAWKKGIK
jgi:hypothetical protein